jgi:kynurenine 3-monooxygenase
VRGGAAVGGSGGPRRKFVIAGGGLGGSLIAILLGKAGHEVELFEKRSDPRGPARDEGRSINLALSTRGIDALTRADIAEEALAESVPMRGRMIHAVDGRLTFQPYGTERGQAIRSVSRRDLNAALVTAAERVPGVRVHFDRRCAGVDLAAASIELVNDRTGERSSARGDAVIGADGAFSAVRAEMQRQDRFDYSQDYLGHGYKELVIPAADGGGFRMEREALHIWPRGGFMMIALPNHDGSYTCTCFWPLTGPNGFASLTTPDEVRAYFARVFPDALPLMPTLVEDYFQNATSSLVTIRCRPWHVAGRVLLLGDACHAVVPFYGQGANAAFEDCVALDACLREEPHDLQAAFARFEAARKENVDALARLAVENFYEMRDHVASRAFLWRKQGEKVLHRLFPRWYVPLYSMITFSVIPYAEAVRIARRQDAAVRAIARLLALALTLALAAAIVIWMVR